MNLAEHVAQLQWWKGDIASTSLPCAPGVYLLLLHLPDPARLTVGRLGTFDFPTGDYVYTGSALSGLRPRLARHLRREKPSHWHIDYLRTVATVRSVGVLTTSERWECALHAQAMAALGGRVVAPGFGSSDCRCRSHLGYLGHERGSSFQEAA
jgi:Uri superfamily endonuclease